MNRDLAWIGRLYETAEIPKEKLYLLRYFDTPTQEAFLRYVLVFDDHKNFSDHTGIIAQKRWLNTLRRRYDRLEAERIRARAEMDLETLAKIESGDFKIV